MHRPSTARRWARATVRRWEEPGDRTSGRRGCVPAPPSVWLGHVCGSHVVGRPPAATTTGAGEERLHSQSYASTRRPQHADLDPKLLDRLDPVTMGNNRSIAEGAVVSRPSRAAIGSLMSQWQPPEEDRTTTFSAQSRVGSGTSRGHLGPRRKEAYCAGHGPASRPPDTQCRLGHST